MNHIDDDFTLRDFLRDIVGAISAGAFVWAVAVWVPHVAAVVHHEREAVAASRYAGLIPPIAAE